ncbi:MAG: response regulator [Deltaproteobacteria bacterium]|nr:response regulator [Deltaproteobacteria bacterium]
MILFVDDDVDFSSFCIEELNSSGFEVTYADNPLSGLEYLKNHQVELIVSDVMMPDMTGFDFQKAVKTNFPEKTLPFIFISSLDDPQAVIKGLETGADDYLTKPLHPGILAAKIRNILQRQSVGYRREFRGNLAALPFVKILQFCENQAITGIIEVFTENKNYRLDVVRGEVDFEEIEDGFDVLEELTETDDGTFHIRVSDVDFSSIESSLVEEPQLKIEKPMGMLSGINSGKGILQIQTEFSEMGTPQIITIVVHRGRTVHKVVNSNLVSFQREHLEEAIKIQHNRVEKELSEKLGKLSEKKTDPDGKPDYNSLFEEGLDCYMTGDFKGALFFWEKAKQLDENNKILQVNLNIVRKKLGLGE